MKKNIATVSPPSDAVVRKTKQKGDLQYYATVC